MYEKLTFLNIALCKSSALTRAASLWTWETTSTVPAASLEGAEFRRFSDKSKPPLFPSRGALWVNHTNTGTRQAKPSGAPAHAAEGKRALPNAWHN